MTHQTSQVRKLSVAVHAHHMLKHTMLHRTSLTKLGLMMLFQNSVTIHHSSRQEFTQDSQEAVLEKLFLSHGLRWQHKTMTQLSQTILNLGLTLHQMVVTSSLSLKQMVSNVPLFTVLQVNRTLTLLMLHK